MELNPVDINQFAARSFSIWSDKWMLLTAGSYDLKKYNCMTISWGSIGIMWNKPFVQVVVRPTRYTYQFINEFSDFTLCVFPDQYHAQLLELGSSSGRDMDKINHSGLTPIKATIAVAPVYEEAELIIECRKIYWQNLVAENFLDEKISESYPENDLHCAYFGEILAIHGSKQYRSC